MSPKQMSLFDDPVRRLAEVAGAVKFGLKRVAAESKLSRGQILDKLNELAEAAGVSLTAGPGKVSQATIDKWLNPNAREHVPPLLALVALCLVLEDSRPIEPALAVLGADLMTAEDKVLRDLGQAHMERQKWTQKVSELRKKL